MEAVIYISETGKKQDEEQYDSFEYEEMWERRDKLEVIMKDILDDTENWDEIYIRVVSE